MTELKELLGPHTLTGCDTDRVIKGKYEDCRTVDFVLDGRTYTALEDPNDGYRSYLGELLESSQPVKNTFPACLVTGEQRKNDEYHDCNIIDLRDTTTGKVVLSIGTDYYDDYYPCFVGEFDPTAMAVNA